MLKIGAQLCMRSIVPSCIKLPIGKENLISINVQSVRNTSFFNRLTQAELWKGVTSVSNAGKRRGRGRLGDRKGKRNLNEGQSIGYGKIGVLWPGLNYNILGAHGVSEIKKLPEDRPRKAVEVKSTLKLRRSLKIHPLDRGWTGKDMKGRRFGPPSPIQDETFEGFESVALSVNFSSIMTAALGRKKRYFALVATGNGNGLIGVGKARATEVKSCVTLAKNRASRRLLTIDLIDKHTVNHNFFSEYGRTRISVFKKPEGYGLCCHRVIAALCRLIGIKDLYAKVEGASNNTKHIVRAFIVGLLRQKTYQEIADERKLHLVEFKEETLYFPQVLASPEVCLTPEEARKNPILFEEYIMGGKLVYNRGPKIPFYRKLPSWSVHLKRTLYSRNHHKVKVDLISKYGGYMSHLTKVYPECRRELF